MTNQREPRLLVVVSLLAAFGIGAVFGALAMRVPGRNWLKPRTVLAPGHPEGSDAERGLEDEVDSMPGDGSTSAPEAFPVKGNSRSGIYHVPGGFAYDRTIADIHFRSAAAAESAGYRASKA